MRLSCAPPIRIMPNSAPIKAPRNIVHQPRSRSGPIPQIGHRLIRRMADGISVGISVARNAEPNRSYIGRRSGTGAVNVMALKWRMIGLGVAGRVSADLRRIDPYDALLRPVLPRWQAGLADPQLPASIRNLGQHKRNCAVLNRSSVAASHGFYLHSAASKNETPCRFLPSK